MAEATDFKKLYRVKSLVFTQLSEHAIYKRRLSQATMLSHHRLKFKCLRCMS